ncbi:MAG: hypothetical protein IJV73_05890 [Clostridia bacterium]|nr:hypothetical protein [Clostridia bacterium]
MKNAIIKAAKLFAVNIAILIGGIIILYLFSIAILVTIFNAIFGDTDTGIYAVNVFIRICLPIISTLIICIPHARNTTARKAFLNDLGAEWYNRKEDLIKVIKTKEFYIECAVFVVVNILMFFIKNPPAWIFILGQFILPFTLWQDVGTFLMRNPPQWIFLVAIPVFPFINLWHHTALHKRWAGERIRLGEQRSE